MDPEGQAKRLQFSISYRATTNPSNGNFSGTSANSFGVALYDVTNSAWITDCSGHFNVDQSSGVGISTGTCQTSLTGTSYRLVWYNATASAGAITMTLDSFAYGPQSKTPAIKATFPAVVAFDNFNPSDLVGTNTNAGTGTLRTNAVEGLTITTNGTATTIASATSLTSGTIQLNFGVPGWYEVETSGSVTYANATTSSVMTVTYGGTATNYANKSPFNPFVLGEGTQDGGGSDRFFVNVTAAAQTLTVRLQYLAVGGGSTPQRVAHGQIAVKRVVDPSGKNEGRIVAANASGTTTGGSGAASIIIMGTAADDTHGAYSTSTGRYTAPVSGWYRATAYLNGSNSVVIAIYVNGVSSKNIFNTASGIGSGSGVVKVNAGDIIDLRTSASIGAWGAGSTMTFEQITGPGTGSRDEAVYARYNGTTGTTVGTSAAAIVFNSKDYDSHNAYNSTTGIFTCPLSRKYRVSGSSQITLNSSVNSGILFLLYKNGALNMRLDYKSAWVNATNVGVVMQGNTSVNCNAGETLAIYGQRDAGATANAWDTSTTSNQISIESVNN